MYKYGRVGGSTERNPHASPVSRPKRSEVDTVPWYKYRIKLRFAVCGMFAACDGMRAPHARQGIVRLLCDEGE